MGKVKVNTRGLKQFQKNLEKLNSEKERDEFMQRCEKRLAADLIANVVYRTPVGVYPAESGLSGGTLRRGWTGGEEADPYVYAANMTVEKVGNMCAIVVYNPTEYASYVEHGHRQEAGRFVPAIGKKLKAGFVEGVHMLENSENELKQKAPEIVQDMLDQWLKGLLS